MATTKSTRKKSTRKHHAKKGVGNILPNGGVKVPAAPLSGLPAIPPINWLSPGTLLALGLLGGGGFYFGRKFWIDYQRSKATEDLANNPNAQKVLEFYNALHTGPFGWTEDEEKIIATAFTVPKDQWANVVKSYKTIYGEDLVIKINEIMTPEQLTRFNGALNKTYNPNTDPAANQPSNTEKAVTTVVLNTLLPGASLAKNIVDYLGMQNASGKIGAWQKSWVPIYAASLNKQLYARYLKNIPLIKEDYDRTKQFQAGYADKLDLSKIGFGVKLGVGIEKREIKTTTGQSIRLIKVRMGTIKGYEKYAGKNFWIFDELMMLTPSPALNGLGCAACGGQCQGQNLGCGSCSNAAIMPIQPNNAPVYGLGSVQVA